MLKKQNINLDYKENYYNTTPPITPKKYNNKFCKNCGKNNHTSYDCIEPIISNGIIGIYSSDINNLNINLNDLETYLINNVKKLKFDINFNDKYNNYLFNNNRKFNIKLLFIQRRNSIAFIEFMRGKYDENNIAELTNLFQNMINYEVIEIKNKNFDDLWSELWDNNNIRNKYHNLEYNKSKQKFYNLKIKNLIDFDNIKCLYDFNEWGFPKGRRENNESNYDCALREFNEETQINSDHFKLLNEKLIIRENLVGTNGFDYAHNYFISIFNNFNVINVLERKYNNEIGKISFFDIETAINLIRPNHKERILIIKILDYLINNFISSLEK
jgi:hypothetical protein